MTRVGRGNVKKKKLIYNPVSFEKNKSILQQKLWFRSVIFRFILQFLDFSSLYLIEFPGARSFRGIGQYTPLKNRQLNKSNMAGEKALRDVCGIYSRLFDHRAVMQNECKYVIREFEGKRNDRELLRLTEASQKANEIQSKIPECVQLAELLNDVQDQLKDARQRCHNILEREEQDPRKKRRDEIKEKSKKQWDEFLKEMDKEEEGIEKEFLAKSLKLKEKYGLIANPESN